MDELLGLNPNLLVEFQVKDEGRSEGLHQEAALGQMDVLGGGDEVQKNGKENRMFKETSSSFWKKDCSPAPTLTFLQAESYLSHKIDTSP